MKLVFTSIKNKEIFEEDFLHLPDTRGTIEFKRMQGAGGVAVVYAPNGTGKSSLANLLKKEESSDGMNFRAIDDSGNNIIPETNSFHIIQDQINRNVIGGKTTDYLVGAQIRREYELKDRIHETFKNAFSQLVLKYKSDFKITKVGDYLLTQIDTVDDEVHHKAYNYIRSLVNVRQHGKDIDKNEFVLFVRNIDRKPTIFPYDNIKKEYIILDLSKTKIVEKILSINPTEIIADENTLLVERHDDAIGILKKYHALDSCVVCDNSSFNGNELLNRKKENRKYIYDNLDIKTKNILDKIVCDSSLVSSDPFEIRKIVGTFISDGDSSQLILLQETLREYLKNIGNEMIGCLYHCFDGTTLFRDYDEHARLTAMQPQLDSEELLFIENVISENIGKSITIVRDEENDRNYKLKIGNKDLLGTERNKMELSTGEQNFVSLAFELLYARHSNKEYIVMDDPISSFDSVYKNKIAFCIIKFLQNKKQIILTHNTDLIRLLDVQLNNCFNLYILNNIQDGENGFIRISEREKKLLINLHDLIAFFQNRDSELMNAIHNRKHFLMSMIPFLRGYAHISLDPSNYYGQLSDIMHGYRTNSMDIIPVYNDLFGNVFTGSELIGVSDILGIDCNNLDIIDKSQFPLLSETLEQTLIYYYLRMKVEKELVDIFRIPSNRNPMLNQIIQRAFGCRPVHPDYEKMREYKVFFTSRKTLLNEFNHFEGNMNIFQPAIDISKSALQKEIQDIEAKLVEIRAYVTI